MKKQIILSLILFGFLILFGCSSNRVDKMTILPATLTIDERKIYELVTRANENGVLYDYNVNKDIKSILIEELDYTNSATPVVLRSDQFSFPSSKGKLYIAYDMDKGILSGAIQGYEVASFSLTNSGQNNDTYISRTQIYLSSTMEIKPGVKIPIALVLDSDSDTISTQSIETYLEQPELLKKYSKAQFITITFLEDVVK